MAEFNLKKIDYSKVRVFVFPLLLLSVITFSLFRFILPRIDQTTKLLSTIRKKERRLSQLTEKLTILKSLNQTELTNRSNLSLKAVPESKKPVFIMNVIGKVADGTGVQITKINTQPGEIATESAKGKKESPSLSFPVEVFGMRDDVITFTSRLENVLPLLRIKKATINSSGQQNLWDVSTIIDSYYLFLPETIGKIDAPVQVLTKEEAESYNRIKNFTLVSVEEVASVESGRDDPFF